jgi:hypothetical protein
VASVFLTRSADGVTDVRDVRAADVMATVREVCGREVVISEESVRLALNADQFVQVRTSRGGVAPAEVARMAADRQQRADVFAEWHRTTSEHLKAVDVRLVKECEALRGDATRI